MNAMRIAISGVAAIAAGAAALLVRGLLGGGTADVQANIPEPVEVVEVLVAVDRIEPGRALTADAVRWETWPDTAVAPELITRDVHPEIEEFVQQAVARSPIIAGEPITEEKIARVGTGGFMAATLGPGKRAIAIPVSEESGAGGFILPNDRVDVILTRELDDEGSNLARFGASTILFNVRVLAIDQIIRQEDEQQAVVARTATLELSPGESELISRAQASGTLSLALRGLGDQSVGDAGSSQAAFDEERGNDVTVLRYGIMRPNEGNLSTGVQTRNPAGGESE